MSAGKATTKEVSIENDMEDDFDDLLDQFQKCTTAPKLEESQQLKGSKTTTETKTKTEDRKKEDWSNQDLSDEFARDLAEGMEALLAGINQEDGGEFKKHLEELVLSGEGKNFMGANDLLEVLEEHKESNASNPSNIDQSSASSANLFDSQPKNFQETIKETMEKLKQSEDSANKAKSGPSGTEDEDEQLSALFEKMMSGENGLPDENQLQNILQSFMEELMSKEIMYEPLKDMNRLFPGWINEHRTKLSTEDLQRYETQSKIIEQVIQKFEDPNWDLEEKNGGQEFISRQKEVIDLLTKMQDCGPPPKEILGDMPPGMLGEGGLPNPEQCLIS